MSNKSVAIDYLGWFADPWRATVTPNGFRHAPRGDQSHAHESEQLDYLSANSAKYSLKREGTEFVHAPERNGAADWSHSHRSSTIHYQTWDGTLWIATYDGTEFTHRQDGSGDSATSERLWGTGSSNLLTFQTNAAWEQRITIKGTDVDIERTGSGEGKIHWQHFTGPGSWVVSAWYRTPGGDWRSSRLRSGRGFGGMYVGADDGGGDGDFEDALITCIPVTENVLLTVPDFLKNSKPE